MERGFAKRGGEKLDLRHQHLRNLAYVSKFVGMLIDFVHTFFKSLLQTYNHNCRPAFLTSKEEESADNIDQELERYMSEDVNDRKKKLPVRVVAK